MGELPVMQRENERGRVAVDGQRTDNGQRCTLVVVSEVGRTWAFYPHGWNTFGVRVGQPEAVKVAKSILDGAG